MSDFDENFWYHKIYQISHEDGINADKYEILNYYRALVGKGELEREEWLTKHESVRVNQGLVHKIEWEIKTRKEEVAELERQLSAREEALNNGREDLMKLARENEELTRSLQTGRDQLMRLMDKTEAIRQDIFIAEGQQPNTIYSYGSQNGSKGVKPKHIVRTLHLPCSQNQEIGKIKEGLLKQLEEQRKSYYAEINEEREKGRKLEYEVRTEFEENQKCINGLIERIKRAQTGKLAAIKDSFLIRHEYELREVDLVKKHEILRERIDSILKETIAAKNNNKKDLKTIQKQAVVKAMDFAHEFRKQADDAKDNYDQITEQYSHLKQVYTEKTRDLEDKYAQLNKKFQELKNRKRLESEGLKTLIKTLEDKIENIENPPRKVDRAHVPLKKTCDRCLEKSKN